jgi:hypothetical protein
MDMFLPSILKFSRNPIHSLVSYQNYFAAMCFFLNWYCAGRSGSEEKPREDATVIRRFAERTEYIALGETNCGLGMASVTA